MYCIIDIETTGGNHKTGKITEVAIIKHDGENIIEEFSSLVNPGVPIPPFITELTGITNDMVEEAPPFYEIAKEVVNITDGCYFVAHNVNFDYRFIQTEFASLGFDYERDRICTIRSSRKLIPGKKSYALGNITKELGINLESHHRAYDDAYATTQLFEILLDIDRDFLVKNLVTDTTKSKKRKPKYHKKFDPQILKDLPIKAGVYYFYDEDQYLIYIGKSKNIKARVANHFHDFTERGIKRCSETVNIDFELTGSELVAALKESAEIKQNTPRFNRAQRKNLFNYGLFDYFDAQGYHRLGVRMIQSGEIPAYAYGSMSEGRSHLMRLCKQYELCQNLCGLYKEEGPCFQVHIGQCKGACLEKEGADSYNLRVDELLEKLKLKGESFALMDQGRNEDELSLILVMNGVYQGYGWIDRNLEFSKEELPELIEKQRDNQEVRQIIRTYMRKNKYHRIDLT